MPSPRERRCGRSATRAPARANTGAVRPIHAAEHQGRRRQDHYSLQWMYAGSDGLKAYAELAHVPEPTALEVRDVYYPRDNMQVDHVSGLASVMADGVEFKYLAAPLAQ